MKKNCNNAEMTVVYDDHGNKNETHNLILVRLANGMQSAFFPNNLNCLNRVYREKADGEVRLSRCSIAGNIVSKNRTAHQAVADYNKELADHAAQLCRDGYEDLAEDVLACTIVQYGSAVKVDIIHNER